MNQTFSLTLPVPISQDAHRFAQQFAREQATPQKGKQVYLNTLAVVAVRDYLGWLSISTAIDQGDCWHPTKRAMLNVADLVLPHLGKLECIPILPNQDHLEISPEVADNRLGYVTVQLSEDLQQVKLLGFVSAQEIACPPESIPLNQLHSLDHLIDTIEWHRKWKNLWKNLTQSEWQPIQLLPIPNAVRSSNSVPAREANFRTAKSLEQSFIRGKVIQWENDPTKPAILLTVRVSENSTEEVDVKMRLYSFEDNIYLPAGLEVSVLDESGVACMKTQAREEDQWIELEVGCKPQEQFSLQITLNQDKIIENFKI
ncbi:hypothetical protein M595_3115 [Lyngbya aestuarii BL J]|uniref:DUF1822 family protein n=1 Tax=Lyngbya aestuarii BL J TaxID=1348334 RepID=U7QKJ2_9CYAN|nr:DUF1822 family protein [Lyngbya aestuarii]ERT06926.1 hypothetical protein M595_3115 [Lyngbya aestuarii BL J]